MHLIRFRLELRPMQLGELTVIHQSTKLDIRGLAISNEGMEWKGRGREERGRELGEGTDHPLPDFELATGL